jgi:protein-S-isoprenylcysteine O-methyltransferase Ste14
MLSVTRAVVTASWIAMLAILAVRHQRLRAPEATRVPTSRLGLLLQTTAYVLVFGWHPVRADLLAQWGAPHVAALAAIMAAVIAAVLVVWCQRTLGVQWSLTARLIEGHRLVTAGPYAHVRNPIYAAMVPMLCATAVAFSSPLVLLVALALYLAGTRIRIASEERLMAAAFGEAWRDYRRSVPALLPRPVRYHAAG